MIEADHPVVDAEGHDPELRTRRSGLPELAFERAAEPVTEQPANPPWKGGSPAAGLFETPCIIVRRIPERRRRKRRS